MRRFALTRRISVRIAAGLLLLCLLAGGGCLLLDAHIRSVSAAGIVAEEDAALLGADCILVLGAGVREDGSPSHMLEDRLLTAVSLYDSDAAPKLLMSGDHGRADYNEVGAMKAYAVGKGIPPDDVFMDHAGFSTYERLYRARDIFGARRVIIVTQEYHLYRALYIARSLGLEAWGVSADRRSYAGQTIRDVREIAARVKDYLWCRIQPEPTYLGEAIPLSGSGDLTNDGENI